MDYIISNGKQYIGVNDHNKIVSCDKAHCKVFSETKARNTWKSLPKSLKNLNFKLVPITDMITEHEVKAERILQKAVAHAEKIGVNHVTDTKKVLETENVKLCEEVKEWLQKIESCSDLFTQAKKRKEMLDFELTKINQQQQDMLHRIELEEHVDAARGYHLYREMRDIRVRRRNIKDELFAVELVLESNIKNFNGEDMVKRINGLKNRKYGFRDQEGV